MRLEPCDIFFTQNPSLLGYFIRKFTTRKGENPSWANHVGLVVEAGEDLDAIAVEALGRVEKHALKTQYAGTGNHIVIFRPLGLTDSEMKKIVDKMNSFVGYKYGWWKLFLQFGDWCLGEKVFFRKLATIEKYPICSFAVARSFSTVNRNFGVSPNAASPDDMIDFCLANPDKYKFIWEFDNGLATQVP